jgi:hypothetical protein
MRILADHDFMYQYGQLRSSHPIYFTVYLIMSSLTLCDGKAMVWIQHRGIDAYFLQLFESGT